MKTPAAPEGPDSEVLERLKAYTALDNPIRLRAFRLLHDSPGVPFNKIAKHIRIESGLLAYHLGRLKAHGVGPVAYAREGRQGTSHRPGPAPMYRRGCWSFSFGSPLPRANAVARRPSRDSAPRSRIRETLFDASVLGRSMHKGFVRTLEWAGGPWAPSAILSRCST